jgi:hypothetical protein
VSDDAQLIAYVRYPALTDMEQEFLFAGHWLPPKQGKIF